MKHLKKFENFDLGRFSEKDDDEKLVNDINTLDGEEDFDSIFDDEEDEDLWDDEDNDENNLEDEEGRIWGDEIVEKKKNKKKKKFSYKESGLNNPKKADLNNNGKISRYEKARGEAIEVGFSKKEQEKYLSKAQMKLPNKLKKMIIQKKKNKDSK